MLAMRRTPETVTADRGFVSHARAIVAEARPALVPTLISTDFVVRGTLNSIGEIQIDGRLEGDATCSRLVIGEDASVNGKITADTVEIRGRVQGEIRAREIRLGAQCHVEGDLVYETLVIEDGAFFEGACRRAGNPRSEDTAKNVAPAQRLAVIEASPHEPAEAYPAGSQEPVHALTRAITERLPEFGYARAQS